MLMWIKDKFFDLYYNIKNRLNHSNKIKTDLNAGYFYDIDTLIETGLPNLVKEFVSKDGQDAFNMCCWDDEQSAELKRKIEEILYFFEVRCVELERSKLGMIKGKFDLKMFNIPKSERINRQEFDRIEVVDRIIERETDKYLHMIIDIRKSLWT